MRAKNKIKFHLQNRLQAAGREGSAAAIIFTNKVENEMYISHREPLG